MTQPTLFDTGGAIRARDEAIARVEANAREDWKTSARRTIRWIAFTHDEFTTDSVWRVLDKLSVEPPHEPRAMGAAMSSAARDRWIEKTDRVLNSVRVCCHRRPLAIWRSLLYGTKPGGDEALQLLSIYDDLVNDL